MRIICGVNVVECFELLVAMVTDERDIGAIVDRHGVIFISFEMTSFLGMATHLFISHSRPISLNHFQLA